MALQSALVAHGGGQPVVQGRPAVHGFKRGVGRFEHFGADMLDACGSVGAWHIAAAQCPQPLGFRVVEGTQVIVAVAAVLISNVLVATLMDRITVPFGMPLPTSLVPIFKLSHSVPVIPVTYLLALVKLPITGAYF